MRVLLVFVLSVVVAVPAHGATPSTVALRGDATHDNRVTGAPEPPLGVRWAAELGETISYPVIAADSVFVTVAAAGKAEAVALDLATGAVRWRMALPPASRAWSALAYEDGRLFALTYDGQLSALAPASGAVQWSIKLGQSSYSAPPTVHAGHLYVTGRGSGDTVHAVRVSDGAIVWEQPLPSSAGSPAVGSGTVYVGMACRHVIAFDVATGAVRWQQPGDCVGGGETTPALHGGRLYALGDNSSVFDAATGALAGSGSFAGGASFADGAGYVAGSAAVFGLDATSGTIRWSTGLKTNGDAPLVSAGHVYVGSADGFVAALAREDGTVRWCAATAGAVDGLITGSVAQPDSGLGAGDGYLVVPAGRRLIAYASGGGATEPCPGVLVTPPTASLSLRAIDDEIVTGRTAQLSGTLEGTPSLTGVAVEIQQDPWPYDGTWIRAAVTTTRSGGSFLVKVRAERNTRLRAVAAGAISPETTVHAGLAATLRITSPRGASFRQTVTLRGPRGTRLAAKRLHFYVGKLGSRTVTRRASARLRRVGDGVYRASATLRDLTPRRRTFVVACYREPRADAFGRTYAIDKACGARRLRLPRAR